MQVVKHFLNPPPNSKEPGGQSGGYGQKTKASEIPESPLGLLGRLYPPDPRYF
jgi:hypothetical protein